jgi:plasmid stabilization system protein ParE
LAELVYCTGRVEGTLGLVVQPNYIVVYRVSDNVVVLRVRHAPRKL